MILFACSREVLQVSLTTFAPIQAYLRKSASRDRLTEHIGPFLATITPDNDNPYMNYAIPEDGAAPSPADVEALIAAYQRYERKPRLEYMTNLAPEVESALLNAGFVVERTTPLMVYAPAPAPTVPAIAGIELFSPQSDQEILDVSAAQREAYGGGDAPSSPDILPGWRRFAAAGGIMVSARDTVTGVTVGGGVCDVPFSATTELAGIGVSTTYRRRGIAAAMTAWLVDQALAAGTTHIFLMAAGENEARIYGRVGFKLIGDVLHISHP
jgi:ribosomal protein S18 acetylase RimI-like enzyme